MVPSGLGTEEFLDCRSHPWLPGWSQMYWGGVGTTPWDSLDAARSLYGSGPGPSAPMGGSRCLSPLLYSLGSRLCFKFYTMILASPCPHHQPWLRGPARRMLPGPAHWPESPSQLPAGVPAQTYTPDSSQMDAGRGGESGLP